MNKLEFRLYYNEEGVVICYTSEKLPGNYLIITPEQFAEARPDVKIVDGKIVQTNKQSHIFKYTKNELDGIATSKYDINILSTQESVFWKIETYEIH